ncbi:Kef-type K+ transport system membrane component KefB [Parabacteroides sp. PH5-13]|uniref:cation:proton antiporter n=1 Tax=unclassified Parabacteroides TaxID=2649774 RepID=UPI0024742F06|nr:MULTISPECIES: cation:proton antiporter [unclassified Parabacteroides]MDH6305238.1 Kef-type K+ transport system membrane component KefB [Parabacteroides sp. PH5-39]MDH6320229.1 Kef-type K+ transport system membrane component KefB [Parabacteroides sp. PH5-13]MDH6323828.1 Kef-type K+ transport system membrane component KefB [Parabacteroides sp. PH5-8]MDH6384940.1 Kef-type K+ transport system membrane component KefB [Parabacteroides sp. PH5-17]MDH6394426.1 Kef-type K+ transport system membrane 
MSKGTKSIAFYLMMILVFGSLMYFIVKQGESRQLEGVTTLGDAPDNLEEGFAVFWKLLVEHITSPIGILLLQIIVILLACRLFGWLFLKMGQPTVIGEILAGIVLGPSILGHLAPDVSSFLFPIESLANINILSQFGLILFMFSIGMELDITEVRKKLKETILISHTSTIVPFFFGMLTAYFIYNKYAENTTPFISFALFIGIAMSITAFPVLARIIQEKGLTKTHLGTITVASAANGDITAWCLLAVVVAIAQAGTMLSAFYNILFSGVYILLMFFVIRPFLRMVGHIYHNKEVIDKGLVALMFLILILSSYLTEILGLHSLFGAFIAGVVMPSNLKFRKIMTEKVEDVSLSLFLPLFFVSTGLRTEIGLLNTPELWLTCAVITLVAIVGKFGGAYFSARFVGESVKNSLYIGALMNTRGLMELVVLTIGYEMGILTPPVFVMLVLMTLVTTFMTTPLISFIRFCYRKRDRLLQEKIRQSQESVFKVLLSFGRASSGQTMLNAAYQMFSKGKDKLEITALHLTVGSDVNPLHTDNFEEVSFGPILYEAQKLGIPIKTRYEVSYNAEQDIVNIVNEGGYDFLLVGAGISLSNLPADVAVNRFRAFVYNKYLRKFKAPESWFYPGALLKDKTKIFIEQSKCAVGVFINRDFTKATNTLLIVASEEDLFLLNYARTLQQAALSNISLVNKTSSTTPGVEKIKEAFDEFAGTVKHSRILPDKDLSPELFDGYNFMLISYHTWNDVSEHRKKALQRMPSTLILNK